MKKSAFIILLFVFYLINLLTGCSNTTPSIQDVMNDYCKMVEGNPPEDIRLTIYYLSPKILTRAPLSEDDLVTFPGVGIITVSSGELAAYWPLLHKLTPAMLKPVQEGSYMNARLYYVFEYGDSNKLLEVVISQIHGTVFVNGIEVEDNPVFYDLIIPFLTEESRNVLGPLVP